MASIVLWWLLPLLISFSVCAFMDWYHNGKKK